MDSSGGQNYDETLEAELTGEDRVEDVEDEESGNQEDEGEKSNDESDSLTWSNVWTHFTIKIDVSGAKYDHCIHQNCTA